jgi:hypothetical protein
MNKKKNLFLIHETQFFFIKSAKARVTGTIPYCHGKVPHSRKLLSLCSELRNFLKFTTEAASQRNSSETTEQNFTKLGR